MVTQILVIDFAYWPYWQNLWPKFERPWPSTINGQFLWPVNCRKMFILGGTSHTLYITGVCVLNVM